MKTSALIVAAGRGRRAGGDIPKQYRMLAGFPVLTHAIRAMLASPLIDQVIAVINAEDEPMYHAAIDSISDPACQPRPYGGSERAVSVKLGLEALAPAPPDKVLIHDAARPFVSPKVIGDVVAALQTHEGALAAVPIVDALRREDEGGLCGDPIERAGVWRAQTPQGFLFPRILEAHHQNDDPTVADDAEIARNAGMKVRLVRSEAENFKITTPGDFDRADRQIGRIAQDLRTGQGFDVHAFAPGDAVILCGVSIPFDKTLSGHSDADVAMHALTDAIFGAIGEGDIGQWYPPSEEEWRGADSSIFLKGAMARVAARGGRLVNADVTIICEQPKIGPHAAAMRTRLAEIMEVEPDRLNVKATTTERLGFTGRGEGISSLATATVLLP